MRRAGSYLAFAGWAVVGLGSLTVVSACIEDLPEPTGTSGQGAAAGSSATATGGGATCDLAGGGVDTTCLSLDGEPAGCSTGKASCYRQDGDDCSCRMECGDDSCANPSQACPTAVSALGAQCLMIPGGTSSGACEPCGCARCMQTCDGVGATYAIRPSGADRLASWEIGAPSSGSLGIYVRARGRFNGMLLGVWGGNSQPFPAPTGTTDPETEFATYVVRNLETWNSPSAAPSEIAIGVTTASEVVIEIDCVVPFVE
jgi:hypothetical protein